MPDSVLAEREAATDVLRARARELQRDVGRLRAYQGELITTIRTGSSPRNGRSLLEGLRASGFVVRSGHGVFRLAFSPTPAAADRPLDPTAALRLSKAAALLREHLPNHEISIESRDLNEAVAAVRFLNEKAGVPGLRLRAVTGGMRALMVEVRPTQIEALQEVLAATVD
jgi:hypothetical protein